MEKPTYEIREWDAPAYDKGCTFQTDAFLYLLNKNNITYAKKDIIDVGCGTARIAQHLAPQANSILCIDASKNMINFAKNNNQAKNISFQHAFAEEFKSDKLYQLGFLSFCFHWLQNQNAALKQMYDNLKDNGELFATIHTINTPEPTSLPAARKTIEFIDNIHQWFNRKSFIELSGSEFPSDQEVTTMLKNTGFTILKMEQQSFECEMTEEEIRNTEWPIISSRPIMQWIPTILIDYFFKKYIEHYLALTQKQSNGKYLEKLTTTIIHARKTDKK